MNAAVFKDPELSSPTVTHKSCLEVVLEYALLTTMSDKVPLNTTHIGRDHQGGGAASVLQLLRLPNQG